MRDVEQLLSAYEVDVDFPDVSGMEHLQMLSTRSQLCKAEGELNSEQRNERIRNFYGKPRIFFKPSHLSPTCLSGGVRKTLHRKNGGGIWTYWWNFLRAHSFRMKELLLHSFQ